MSVAQSPRRPLASNSLQPMEDLGAPGSYLTLSKGLEVYSSDGRSIGKVAHVLADPDADLFEGFVIDTSVLPGGHRFVDATQVDEIYDRGVVLTIDAAAAESLPNPSANPGEIEVGPDDVVPDELHDKLRRAWDRISGKG
jgi:sporulation protein YlmC with PRC-barrel domain